MHHRAIRLDLFADQEHRNKIDTLGDPLVDIEKHIDFEALVAKVGACQGGTTDGVTQKMGGLPIRPKP